MIMAGLCAQLQCPAPANPTVLDPSSMAPKGKKGNPDSKDRAASVAPGPVMNISTSWHILVGPGPCAPMCHEPCGMPSRTVWRALARRAGRKARSLNKHVRAPCRPLEKWFRTKACKSSCKQICRPSMLQRFGIGQGPRPTASSTSSTRTWPRA